jgi:hypothetical protein
MDHLANECARKGYLEALQWLYVRKKASLSARTVYAAALHGRLGVVKWLHLAGCPWDKATYHIANYRGYTAITNYMREEGFDDVADIPKSGLPPVSFFSAVSACRPLPETGPILSDEAPRELGYVCTALRKMDILRDLVETNHLQVDEFCCCIAAERGDVPMLAYLRDECECPWDERALRGAVGAGQGHMVLYLLENGCPKYKIAPDTGCVIS